ncbi:sugar phosphate isomerase/epimerase [Galbibacter sp. PAP.153]|uniref:sugar phosphate isomerase/epimerase family protein n=1 Tax=Galbibacter sp. PAP.153 TaxID=3104623 RepID=UPI003009C674
MNRRHFMGAMGALGASSLFPYPAFATNPAPNYKLGLQLYTINNEMIKDPVNSLKAVKEMGYEDFEIFGFDAEKNTFYGINADEFNAILNDLDLTVSSGHFGFSTYLNASEDVLMRFVDQCIVGAQKLNMKYITWPWIAPEQRTIDNFKLMSKRLNVIGERINKSGLGFAYHNHGFEFEDHNGENGFDLILKETDPDLVKLEMDMYWVMRSSNYTPKELVELQPKRFVLWHIKDMDKITKDYTELGNGSIDYTKILPDPTEAGLEYYYLEQGGNFAHSPMQSVKDSIIYFKKHVQQYVYG